VYFNEQTSPAVGCEVNAAVTGSEDNAVDDEVSCAVVYIAPEVYKA
jgi:hypothetical protein